MNSLNEIPWQYDFPPFYTLQPNEKTRIKQIDAWCDFVINYCKQNRLFQIDIIESQSNDLFSNKKIDRKLSLDMIRLIIDELRKNGRAEWVASDNPSNDNPTSKSNSKKQAPTPTGQRKCIILWHTIDEWAKLIYDYVVRQGLQNTVCTYYELTESDECSNEEFYKLDLIVLRKALKQLQNQNKAEIFQIDSFSEGVKFF